MYIQPIRKNEIMPFAGSQDQEIIIASRDYHTELSESEREMSYDIAYMQNLKINYTNGLNCKYSDLEKIMFATGKGIGKG